MSLRERLGSIETAWWVGRRIAPRVAVTLAPAAGYGVDRVPLEGGGVVAANHFSGIDHPLIGAFSPRPLYFLAKAELFEIPVLGPVLSWLGVFAVRRGEGDREAVRRARELAREGNLVCVHVEGTRQRFGHPGPLHPGGLMIAMQEGVPVIPCAVDTFGWRPWNRRTCSVVWGEPLSVADLPRNRKGYAEAGERVGEEIVRLWRLAVAASAVALSGGDCPRPLAPTDRSSVKEACRFVHRLRRHPRVHATLAWPALRGHGPTARAASDSSCAPVTLNAWRARPAGGT